MPRPEPPPFDARGWQAPAFVREGVVVADDDLHMRRLILAALRQFGFAPIEAARFREDQERAVSAARIDLVVADLVLPEAWGTGMARRWRLKRPRLKAVCLKANARALFDAHLHKVLSLNGVCEALASLHDADVTSRCDLRRWYSMTFRGVSDDLCAQAGDLFAPGAPRSSAETNSTNAVIVVFAELPRDEPFDQVTRPGGDTANVDAARRLTETWQFARPEPA